MGEIQSFLHDYYIKFHYYKEKVDNVVVFHVSTFIFHFHFAGGFDNLYL